MANKWKGGIDQRVIYQPRNPVAAYTDKNGDERIIHAPKGRSVRRFEGSDTPQRRMNRAAAIFIGQAVRERRMELGMTQKDLCIRAGLVNTNPKAYICDLEMARRAEGMRLGTLFALAVALQCEVADLLPPNEAVMEMAGVGTKVETTIVTRSA
jgi:DNA-binding Xre family transcriptional regulator